MTDEIEDWDDNPEWTKEDFARARPASEMVSPEILAQLVRPSGIHPITALRYQAHFARQLQVGTLLAA